MFLLDFSDADNLNEEEKQAMMKEEKSRERNRDHSRKSRLRKKEFVESLKHEVSQLQIYQQICEQCLDLIALVSQDAIFMYSSAAYSRVLGYQGHQLIAGQTSFLDLVHPVSVCIFLVLRPVRRALTCSVVANVVTLQENVQEVRSVFQKFSALGESRKCKHGYARCVCCWCGIEVYTDVCVSLDLSLLLDLRSSIPDKISGRRILPSRNVGVYDGQRCRVLHARGPRRLMRAWMDPAATAHLNLMRTKYYLRPRARNTRKAAQPKNE